MLTSQPSSKRRFLRYVLALGWLPFIPAPAYSAALTPQAGTGPFYPTKGMRFQDADNDLVLIAGNVQQAGGEIVVLQGRVLDENANPVGGARVEIWQCDMNGRYLHTGDTNATPDPNFQGFGHVVTVEDGSYAFRTIRPVSYPGRTPHIHVKVFTPGREFTTQFYIKDHPDNRRDGLFRRMQRSQIAAVLMDFKPGGQLPTATIDIVVDTG